MKQLLLIMLLLQGAFLSAQRADRAGEEAINVTDDKGRKQGLWVDENPGNNYQTSYYKDDEVVRYELLHKNDSLLEEREYANGTLVKHIRYANGKAYVSVNKPFTRFYLNNFTWISMLLVGLFVARIFVNSHIYNIENGTNYLPIFFRGWLGGSPRSLHSINSLTSLWILDYEERHKKLARISHGLTILLVCAIFILAIGLIVDSIK